MMCILKHKGDQIISNVLKYSVSVPLSIKNKLYHIIKVIITLSVFLSEMVSDVTVSRCVTFFRVPVMSNIVISQANCLNFPSFLVI